MKVIALGHLLEGDWHEDVLMRFGAWYAQKWPEWFGGERISPEDLAFRTMLAYRAASVFWQGTMHSLAPLDVAAETARRLSCDASLVAIIEDEKGEPLNVGRKTRSIPSALQRGLNARDQGCRFPGCTHRKYTDAHHIMHWARGGETKMSNLVTLCRFHHRKVHEGQVIVQVLDDGAIRFVQPNGQCFDTVSLNRGDWRQLPAVDARAAATRWDGGPMDYGIAMDNLMWLRRHVSAETSR